MKKRIIIFALLSLILIGIGLYFMQHLDEGQDDTHLQNLNNSADAAPVPFEHSAEQISVVSVAGSAEKKSALGQSWSPMSKGDMLNVDDAVRTRDDSTVVLGLGEASTIELSNASEIEVRELSGVAQRLGLIKGRASVDYGENGKRVLNIENSDGTVVAKVDQGKFSILNNGRMVAVATETGSVDLSAAGESVTVTSGMESVVEKGHAPVAPYKVSTQAYLKLSAGACKKYSETVAVVRGTVSTGTAIMVNEQDIRPNPDGSFLARVRMLPNARRVQLKTTDIWGNIREQTLNCTEPKNSASIKNVVIDWGSKGD
ncbi:MAG: FecR domain-containing protein [Deltaproteobacteria bacterium]|nr:FecR domain-containing protein [Deltaproteobacteria bacterium]